MPGGRLRSVARRRQCIHTFLSHTLTEAFATSPDGQQEACLREAEQLRLWTPFCTDAFRTGYLITRQLSRSAEATGLE